MVAGDIAHRLAATIYIVSINVQIRQAYLWSDGDLRRTIGTSLTYIILCMLMAYVVLRSVSSCKTTLGDIWACLLVAVLSLTGIGWSGPNSWVESIGIKSPNYADARLSVIKLAEILQRVRKEEIKGINSTREIEDFLQVGRKLRFSIKENLHIEPKWAKYKLQRASEALRTLLEQTEEQFPTSNKSKVEDFPIACRYQKEDQYKEFIQALKDLSAYWPKWQ